MLNSFSSHHFLCHDFFSSMILAICFKHSFELYACVCEYHNEKQVCLLIATNASSPEDDKIVMYSLDFIITNVPNRRAPCSRISFLGVFVSLFLFFLVLCAERFGAFGKHDIVLNANIFVDCACALTGDAIKRHT